ncbi:MAG: PLD nuclease N-terminal domain-containing protein [Stackebrandtia sp.]
MVMVFLANLVLLVAAIADCLGGEREPRRWSRGVWVALILIFPIVGGVAWFLAGRPLRQEAGRDPGPSGRTGQNWRPRNRPTPPSAAPDDDPEFLRDLERRLREEKDDR